MNYSNFFKILIFCVFLTFSKGALMAQNCGTCNVSITANDTLDYTVNAGETLCIDTTGIYTGNVVLNGGTVCNNGFFRPSSITFNSGTINNISNSSFNTAITLSSSRVITNQPGGILNIKGTLTITGGSLINDGILNIDQNITNSNGTFVNSNIINCLQVTGSNTITNSGVINTN